MRKHRGQASIETVVLLPVLAVCGLGAWQVLLVAWALVAAGDSARAGARAVMSSEPPRPAVVRALPGSMRNGVTITVGEARLQVTVRVPSAIPGFSPHVTASADLVRR